MTKKACAVSNEIPNGSTHTECMQAVCSVYAEQSCKIGVCDIHLPVCSWIWSSDSLCLSRMKLIANILKKALNECLLEERKVLTGQKNPAETLHFCCFQPVMGATAVCGLYVDELQN